ncbi:MAG: SEC-C metal-binding domain-containing protein [Pseudomonadota bacterium]
MKNIGRNDPCSCGSGRKYKHCCLAKAEISNPVNLEWRRLRRAEGEIVDSCLHYAKRRYGENCIIDAWEEFALDSDIAIEKQHELEGVFIPWFVFNWLPFDDNEENDGYSDFPIAINYMTEKSYNFDKYQREFIQTSCREPFTFYAITDVKPGESITFRDLFLKRDITVLEKSASSIVKIGYILFARIITINDVSIMLGCASFPIPPRFHLDLLDLKKDLQKSCGELNSELLCDIESELRETYFNYIDSAFNPKLPELRNTDGDPMVIHNLEYELICSPQKAYDRLKSLILDDMSPDDETHDKTGNLTMVKFTWSKHGNKMHAEWDNTTLGILEIDGKVLKINVNSEKRARKIQSEVKKRMGKDAILKKVDVKTVEDMMKEHKRNSKTKKSKIKPKDDVDYSNLPEMPEYLKNMVKKNWESWLDKKLPALNNKTPRQASKTEEGRERLEALLLEFNSEKDIIDNILLPDIPELRKKLGLKSR